MTTASNSTTFSNDRPGTGRRLMRLGAAAGAVLAVAAIGLVVTNDRADPAVRASQYAIDTQYRAELAVIAEMARAQGLTGLSPVSLRPVDADPTTAAEDHPLYNPPGSVRPGDAGSRTVASPGSVRAIDHRDELAAVADMARANGLTGLSPASLTAVDPVGRFDAHRPEILAAIADAAVAEGLFGMSPASLRPINR
jgi:hypothetical protein